MSRFPYIKQYTDKIGVIRSYVRRKGFPETPIPGRPGSSEFILAYRKGTTGIRATRDEQKKFGFVYFLDNGEFIKIGFSITPKLRLDRLQTSSPRPLRVIGLRWGIRQTERDMHARFKHLRVTGEWFAKTPDLLDAVSNENNTECLTAVSA